MSMYPGRWGSWNQHLVYDNSHYSSVGMTPYEAMYGRKYRSPLCYAEIGSGLIKETNEKIKIIQKKMRKAQDQ